MRESVCEKKRKRGGKWTREKNGVGWTETERGLWGGLKRRALGSVIEDEFFSFSFWETVITDLIKMRVNAFTFQYVYLTNGTQQKL